VRITPQLVKVADQAQIWANIYDDQISELFEVQGKVAAEVVNALDVVLADRERKALQVAPTANLEAYNCYLRGREYWHRFEDRQDLAKGLDILYQAVDLDSTFADAYAYISSIHSFMFWASYDHSEERLKKALETALLSQRYDSLGAYSNWALGYYYYYGERDYTRALHHFEQTLQRLPNSADGWAASGYVKRRMGRWTESLSDQRRALELDPLSSTIRYDMCNTLRYMRRFDEALQVVNRGLDLYPGHTQLLIQKARTQLYGQDDPAVAIATLNVDSTDQAGFGDLFNVEFARFQTYIVARNYDSALAASYRIRSNAVDPTDTARGYKAVGQAYFLKGQADESRIWLDSARASIESLWKRGFLEAGWTPPTIGPVYAMLGRKDEAIKLAREEAETLSLQYDAMLGCESLEDLAITYAIVGEADLAFDLLDSLLSMPSELTVHKLRGYPFYDPLRDHPRFQELIEKYEKEHGI
jgi:tetratricopeptide (TPR) repeat protein